MGGQTKGTTREERVARAIERNKREEEAREIQRHLIREKQKEERRLQVDKENGVINYLIENGIDMELDKLYILDVAGEEVTLQPSTVESVRRCRVSFGKGREIIDYTIEKDEEGEVNVIEIKDSRLTVRKQKKSEETLMMISAMSSLGANYGR